MKTIVAISDNHYTVIPDKLKSVINETDYFFYLGDGVSGLNDLLFHKNMHAVRGNNDYPYFPDEEVVDVDGIRCLLTHGHLFHVRQDYLRLKLRAQELNCSVVFFGHTHEAVEEVIDGITFINPGAITSPVEPSYAYCVVSNGKMVTKIVQL